MNVRPYLVLWFTLAFFAVLVGWGLYHKLNAPEEPPAPATQAAQPPLVDRLREERERRLAERESSTTAPSPATAPTTQP